jgi:RNA polymerase sigma-70 factor (ECF subfamily)
MLSTCLPAAPLAPRFQSRAADPAQPRVLQADALGAHLDRLYRAALSMCGSPADAEDLVQEVCVRALAKPRLVRGADDLPYLLRMLRNVFYNECRRQASRRTTPVEPETLTAVPGGPRDDPEFGAEMREVHEAIAALAPHYRDVLVAVDVVGLPYADAADALGVPVGTVMSRLHRARAGVARRVGEESVAG